MNATPGAEGRSPAGRVRWTLQTGYWLVRAVAFVLITALTLTRASDVGQRVFEAVVLALGGVLMALWAVLYCRGYRRESPPWVMAVTVGALAAVGGLGAALSPARSVVFFAVIAALAAGNDLSFDEACAVTIAGIFGVEAGGVLFGFSTGIAVGLPLVLIVAMLAGRARREARVRADQSAELMAQMRRAQSEQRRAAALDERNRIAREIHDVLAHALSALGIQIEAARAALGESGDVAAADRFLEQAHQLANDGLEETHRAIHALRADTPPLPDSLATLAANHQQHYGRPVDLSVTGDARPLRPDASLALIRAAGEALTNVAKHASGASVIVTLDYGPEHATLTISNAVPAGKAASSISDSGENAGGYGLAGMRERLLLINGTLTAGSTGDRWTVQAEVPS